MMRAGLKDDTTPRENEWLRRVSKAMAKGTQSAAAGPTPVVTAVHSATGPDVSSTAGCSKPNIGASCYAVRTRSSGD